MSADRPEELKGWPKSWYVNGDEDGDLRCPAVGCDKVFRTAEEVINLGEHFKADDDEEDWDTAFHHHILFRMTLEAKCPKCDYRRNPRPTLGDADPRELFKHERDAHDSDELSDIKKFIGLIRKHRSERFGGGPEIWPELHEYYKTNIQKQPEYPQFKTYVEGCGLDVASDKHLDEVAEADRGSDFPPGLNPHQRKFYPVHIDGFLNQFPMYKVKEKELRDSLKEKYSKGEF